MEIDIEKTRKDVATWLEKMAAGFDPGRFSFCSSGGIVPTDGPLAQMPTCFAMKIAWQMGLWEEWNKEKQGACIDFIKSFQRTDGYFDDPWLKANAKNNLKDYARVLLGRAHWKALTNRSQGRRRAETRQSASTLLMVGEKPDYPLPTELKDADNAVHYVKGLDWKYPWAAASHFSHQLFLLSVNEIFFGYPVETIIDALVDTLSNYYDPDTGTWYDSNPPDAMKINGAMKVYSGLQWLSFPYPEASVLMDFALKQPFIKDGCGFLNRLFVVYNANKAVPEGYRKESVHKLAHQALEIAANFRSEGGAFSFFEGKSQINYYGAVVSRGDNVSDLHGTAMFVWAIALALKILGKEAPKGSENWKPHKT
ncbi:MAG: hypothetical protein OEV42_08610 [Deltaproteobacteria bacterium]|nr:hypothetical protein [Deltaproteobacteria bacterium]